MSDPQSKIERPPTFEEYPDWLMVNHDIHIHDLKVKNKYEMESMAILSAISQHEFISAVDNHISELANEYKNDTGTALLLGAQQVHLERKPFESVINKSYRENIAWNKCWPKEPSDKWAFPDTWVVRFDDIIRTTIVCRYVDGCAFISNGLVSLAKKLGLVATSKSLQQDEGYYAYHTYVEVPVDFIVGNVKLEIQVTTQVQDLLRSLSHSIYEDRRIKLKVDRSAWKWDFKSSEFMSGYVGHTLHFLEGILVQMRESSMGLKKMGVHRDVNE